MHKFNCISWWVLTHAHPMYLSFQQEIEHFHLQESFSCLFLGNLTHSLKQNHWFLFYHSRLDSFGLDFIWMESNRTNSSVSRFFLTNIIILRFIYVAVSVVHSFLRLISTLQFVNPSTNWWIFGLFPVFVYKWSNYKHTRTCLSVDICFHSSWFEISVAL